MKSETLQDNITERKDKVKTLPLHAVYRRRGFQEFRIQAFETIGNEVGKFVNPTHWPTLPAKILLVLTSVRGCVDCCAIVPPEELRL
jgi:hypothetical protein